MPLITRREIRRGGFSKEVWGSKELQDYVHGGCVVGYVGDAHRTEDRDRILEKTLRDSGLSAWSIAQWISSTSARHLMDPVDRNTGSEKFGRMVEAVADGAFLDVTIWNHPNHTGTWKSRMEIQDKLLEILQRISYLKSFKGG